MPLAAGTLIGSYEIVEVLGAGAMGEVYRARDRKLNRDVAVKVLLDSGGALTNASSGSRAKRRALAALNHPNIAQVYDIEEDATAGPCIVMELVPGRTLGADVRGRSDADHRSADDRAPDRRRARGRARGRPRAPRSQAGQHQGPRRRHRQGARLRVGQGRRDRHRQRVRKLQRHPQLADDGVAAVDGAQAPTGLERARDDAGGRHHGHARVHEPRAGERAGRSIGAPTSGRSARSSTKCSPAAARSTPRIISETLAAVLTRQIDLADLPSNTPERLRRLIRRCLVREPRQRLRDIGDARADHRRDPCRRYRRGACRRMRTYHIGVAALHAVGDRRRGARGRRGDGPDERRRAGGRDAPRTVTRSATAHRRPVRLRRVVARRHASRLYERRRAERVLPRAAAARSSRGAADRRHRRRQISGVFARWQSRSPSRWDPAACAAYRSTGGDVIELCDGDFSNGADVGRRQHHRLQQQDGSRARGGQPAARRSRSPSSARTKSRTSSRSSSPLGQARTIGSCSPFGRVAALPRRDSPSSRTAATARSPNGGDNGRFVASGLARQCRSPGVRPR